MSQFEYVHKASPRKLPFLHSKFKPRSKFAKSFGGCNKFSKLRQSASQDEAESVRLPRITYDAQDIRDTPPTFGSMRRGTRREYPGFSGSTKILRHNKNAHASSQAMANGVRCSSRDSHSLDGDRYLAFPSPHELKDSDRGNSNPSCEWFQQQTSATRRRDQRLANGLNASDQSQAPEKEDSNFKPSELIKDMDSLFISDDDEKDADNKDATKIEESFSGQPTESAGVTPRKDQAIRFAENTHFGDEEDAKNDPFTRNFEEKLKEIRGKSGVKRDRTRKRLQRKRGDTEMRPLGDVITTKRLQELLLPDSTQGVTIRLHS